VESEKRTCYVFKTDKTEISKTKKNGKKMFSEKGKKGSLVD